AFKDVAATFAKFTRQSLSDTAQATIGPGITLAPPFNRHGFRIEYEIRGKSFYHLWEGGKNFEKPPKKIRMHISQFPESNRCAVGGIFNNAGKAASGSRLFIFRRISNYSSHENNNRQERYLSNL
ncbi:MAG: hypothetical protein WA140_10415, partial [Geobacteraceae bacterium]